jgi:succinate dehydrogenase / fumarate reductase iron-sulfur subunit
MNINGKNALACITKLVDLKEPVVIKPLPGCRSSATSSWT